MQKRTENVDEIEPRTLLLTCSDIYLKRSQVISNESCFVFGIRNEEVCVVGL